MSGVIKRLRCSAFVICESLKQKAIYFFDSFCCPVANRTDPLTPLINNGNMIFQLREILLHRIELLNPLAQRLPRGGVYDFMFR